MKLKLITSNQNKLNEFRRITAGQNVEFTMKKGRDLAEVAANSTKVAVYKSITAGEGTIVEDTVLIVDGIEVVDVRYKLDEINNLQNDVSCEWVTTLAVNIDNHVKLFKGKIEGVLKSLDEIPGDAFGFDANFYPAGSDISLYQHEKNSTKDKHSARKSALDSLIADNCYYRVNIDSVPAWAGDYQ